jgi:protein TonB
MPKRKRPRLPTYPATLKTQGVEADVTVMVSLDETGKVKEVKIITPSPYPEFNEAARTTALKEEFEPALRDGVPVAYTLSYTYRFRIEER